MLETFEIDGLEFKRDSHSMGWNTAIEINGWSEPDARQRVNFSIDATDERTGESRAEPSEGQKLATVYFLEHQDRIVSLILDALLRFTTQLSEQSYGYFEEIMPAKTLEELRGQIETPQFIVNATVIDGYAWMGAITPCDWDIEHASGVSFWQDVVLGVGHADTSFSSPQGFFDEGPESHGDLAWQMQQMQRNEILKKFHDAEEEIEAEAIQQARHLMPDGLKLAMAICEGNQLEVDRLKKEGVDINATCKPYDPPVFLALMQHDPAILQAMLDAGARADVRNQQQQTPLQFVQQMIDGLSVSQKFHAGDAVALQDMLGQSGGADMLSQLMNSMTDATKTDDPGNGTDELSSLIDAATRNLGNMFGKLGGISAMMEGASPERLEQLQQTRRDTNSEIARWTKFAEILKNQR